MMCNLEKVARILCGQEIYEMSGDGELIFFDAGRSKIIAVPPGCKAICGGAVKLRDGDTFIPGSDVELCAESGVTADKRAKVTLDLRGVSFGVASAVMKGISTADIIGKDEFNVLCGALKVGRLQVLASGSLIFLYAEDITNIFTGELVLRIVKFMYENKKTNSDVRETLRWLVINRVNGGYKAVSEDLYRWLEWG